MFIISDWWQLIKLAIMKTVSYMSIASRISISQDFRLYSSFRKEYMYIKYLLVMKYLHLIYNITTTVIHVLNVYCQISNTKYI